MEENDMEGHGFDTKAVHAGQQPDPATGAVTPPIYMTTTFKLPEDVPLLRDALLLKGDSPPHVYTRWSNPSLRTLEEKMCALEGAEAGVTFASGMGAVSGLLLTLLSGGDHVVASDVCYMGSVELMGSYLGRFGIEASLVDTSDLDAVGRGVRPHTT